MDPEQSHYAIVNSKGFGGNNATASMLAPYIVEQMLGKRHGKQRMAEYRRRNETVREQAAAYDQATIEGDNRTIYKFDHNVLGSESIEMDTAAIRISDIPEAISLQIDNSYDDMCD